MKTSPLFLSLLPLLAPAAAYGGDEGAKAGLLDLDGAKSVLLVPIASPRRASWQIGGGLAWRRIGETSVSPRAQAASNFLALPTGVGAEDVADDRTYDNGFVNQGAGTPNTGLTTFFGYTGPAPQVGDELVFTRGGGVAVDAPVGGREGNETAVSPYVDLSYLIPIGEDLEVGITGGFAYTGLDQDFRSQVTESSITTIDRFDLGGVIPPSNDFGGSFAGPGPLIGNVPTSREQVFTETGTGSFEFEQDVDLYSLSLGGDLRWKVGQDVVLGAGAGVVLNIASWEARSSNVVVDAATASLIQKVSQESDREVLWGVYLEGSVGYQINESWGIEANARYDWTEDLDATVGETDFTVDLSGWSLGVGASYRF